MLTIERARIELLSLPLITRVGLGVMALGLLADVAAHIAAMGHADHVHEHTAPEQWAHLVGFGGMVLAWLGIVVDGMRSGPSRPRPGHHHRPQGHRRRTGMSRKLGLGAIVGTLTAALALAFTLTATPPADAADGHGAHGARTNRAAFHDAMRQLWEDHIVWTRQFIVSAATGPENLPDTDRTAERLLRNQADIGDALGQFYGERTGDAVEALLRDHILTAADIIGAAKAGDGAGVDEAVARWYVNADDIATALHELNPANWPLDEMQAHMKDHLDLTLDEALARLQGRYADDIAAYDAIHAQILDMADMLSDGIVAQFPSRFAR